MTTDKTSDAEPLALSSTEGLGHNATLLERLRAGTGGGKHWMDLHTEAADEIEHLAAAATSHFKQAMLNGEAALTMRAALEEIESLDAEERKHCAKDSARMDWLDDQFRVVVIGQNKDGNGAVRWITNMGHWSESWRTERAENLRAAIDAAMTPNV